MKRSEKATAYFGMTRKYLRFNKGMMNTIKLCDTYEEHENMKQQLRKDFYESMSAAEINEFMKSSYADGWKWFCDREKENV